MSLPKRPKRTRRTASARKQWQRFIEKFCATPIEKRFDWDFLRQEFEKFCASWRSIKAMERKVNLKSPHRGADITEVFFERVNGFKKKPPIRSSRKK